MALHFVGFRGDEYYRACQTFGMPDFIHRDWDFRAVHEVTLNEDGTPADTVVFGPKGFPTKGHEYQAFPGAPALVYAYTYDDSSFF